ncbi:MAG TPA: hypothetical protein VFO93_14585 [Hymenobacter sp.]|nr:hypothetical protein [Hymenobacter sp.]
MQAKLSSTFQSLLMIITDIKEFRIQYDAPLRLLRVEWAGGHDMRRLRPALEQLHQLAHGLEVTHGLLAFANLPDISAYDQIWLGSQWLPRAERLAIRQAVLVLDARQIYNQQAIETLLMFSRPKPGIDFQFFRQAATGMQWLANDSPRLPLLFAEWAEAYGPALPADDAVAEPLPRYGRPH